jgi:hypothetical protein
MEHVRIDTVRVAGQATAGTDPRAEPVDRYGAVLDTSHVC